VVQGISSQPAGGNPGKGVREVRDLLKIYRGRSGGESSLLYTPLREEGVRRQKKKADRGHGRPMKGVHGSGTEQLENFGVRQ